MSSTNEWPTVKLGQVAEILMGQAPPSSATNQAGLGYPLIAGAGDFSSTGIEPTKFTDVDTRLSEVEDIILSIRATIGPFRIADKQYALGRGVSAIRASDTVDNSFLTHYIRYSEPALKMKGRGATFLQISRRDLSDLDVPLPPLAEQQRIAEILDSSGTVIQQIESQLLLLADLATSYAAHHSEHEKIAPLSSFGSFSGGMTPDKKNPSYWGGLIRWFTTKDLKKPVLVDSIDHATDQAIDETSLKLIDTPSIAFSLRGMSLAHTVPMSRLPAYSTVNQDLKAFVPHDPDHVRVLYTLIKAKTPWLLSKVSTAGHGTKKLDFTHLQNMELPVLPEEEFAQLDKVLSQIEDLEQKKNQELESFRELQESLSTRAFAGQL